MTLFLQEKFVSFSEQPLSVRIEGVDLQVLAISRPIFDTFRELLLTDEPRILAIALKSTASDTLYQGLVNSLSEDDLFRVLLFLIQDRVNKTTIASDLFRIDDADITLMGWMCRASKTFQEFLRVLFKAPLLNLLTVPAAFDIDPQTLTFPLMLEGNKINLRNLMLDFLDKLSASSPLSSQMETSLQLPAFLKNLGQFVFHTVEAKFPGHGKTAWITLFVLRGLSHALCFPERYNIIKYEPSASQRRALITFARLFQHIFNGQTCNEGNVFSPFNDIILGHQSTVSEFLTALLTPPTQDAKSSTVKQLRISTAPSTSTAPHQHTKYDFLNILEGIGRAAPTIFKQARLHGEENGTSTTCFSLNCDGRNNGTDCAALRFVFRCQFGLSIHGVATARASDDASHVSSPSLGSDDDNFDAIQLLQNARDAVSSGDQAKAKKHLDAIERLLVQLEYNNGHSESK